MWGKGILAFLLNLVVSSCACDAATRATIRLRTVDQDKQSVGHVALYLDAVDDTIRVLNLDGNYVTDRDGYLSIDVPIDEEGRAWLYELPTRKIKVRAKTKGRYKGTEKIIEWFPTRRRDGSIELSSLTEDGFDLEMTRVPDGFVYEETTTYRPVVETNEKEERHKVLSPVRETTQRTEYRTVYKPVWEFVESAEQRTVYRANVTYDTVYDAWRGWITVPKTTYQPQLQRQMVPQMMLRYVEERQYRVVPTETVRYAEEEQIRRVPGPARTVDLIEEKRVRFVPNGHR